MSQKTLGLGTLWTAIVAAGFVAGCSTDSTKTADVDAREAASETDARALAREGRAGAARLDQALKSLERGGDAKAALAELEAVLADKRTSMEDQDEARLGISAAREALGDVDGAVEALEELFQAHGDTTRFEGREIAEKRLRKLLTGSETTKDRFTPSERYAPSARALAPYFKADEKGSTLVDIYAFGDKGGGHADELGMFNVPAAKRDLLLEKCATCDQNLDMGRSFSRTNSWTAIPRAMGDAPADMPQIDRSMLVFYFDLGDDRVPSRYDEYLPIPSAEIVQHLERGEGLIAFKERPNAKPTLVLAAPRVAQLSLIEDAFAALTEMPKAPLVVTLAPELRSEEIQFAVRSVKADLRACYEDHLRGAPTAAGSIVFDFGIAPDGSITNVALDEKTTLKDEKLGACATGVMQKLRFPASPAGMTRVTYPLAFTPS